MKKLVTPLLCLALFVQLTACGRLVKLPTQPFDTALVAQLMESDAFSEPLEPLDKDLVWILYDMDASGLQEADLTSAAGGCSAGATCEQAAVMVFASQASAVAAREHLDRWLAGQAESNRSYRPAEVPKLEKAILSQRDNTLLLAVAHNYDAVAKLING